MSIIIEKSERRFNMNWQIVKIPNESRGKCTPYASVGHNSLSLNAAACDLIENYEDYNFVELLRTEQNKKVLIGVKLCKSSSTDSIKIVRTKYKEKYVKGITISNKKVLESLFGVDRASGAVTRFPVTKDTESDNILIITL